MKDFPELEQYVKAQAAAYRATDELWEADTIELDTFREILRFALSEGFQARAGAIERVLNGEDESAEYDDENYTDWHYMGELTDLMNQQIAKNELPERTTHLYKTWLFESRDFDPEFWNDEYGPAQ